MRHCERCGASYERGCECVSARNWLRRLDERYAAVDRRVLERLYDRLKVEDNPCIELGND